MPLPAVLAGYRVGTRFLWQTVLAEAAATGLADSDALVAARRRSGRSWSSRQCPQVDGS
jgi:hypothetical protein